MSNNAQVIARIYTVAPAAAGARIRIVTNLTLANGVLVPPNVVSVDSGWKHVSTQIVGDVPSIDVQNIAAVELGCTVTALWLHSIQIAEGQAIQTTGIAASPEAPINFDGV
jgi:LEA14-like dessication related protein